MPNPYMMDPDRVMAMLPEEKAYIAGFFDGEGSMAVYYQPKYARMPVCKVTIYQNTPTVLEWIHSYFGGCFRFVDKQSKAGSTVYRQNGYEWALNGVEGPKLFIRAMLPFLRVKRSEAEEVLFILKHRETLTREEVMDKVHTIRSQRTHAVVIN